MANTIGGINLAQIAQETLRTLLPQMPMLSAFTTDFSGDIAIKGESVTTRVATATAAGDASGGYTSSDVTSTAKTITLNKHKHFTMGFTDAEAAKGGLDMLRRTFIEPAANCVVNAFLDDLLALVIAATFANSTLVTAANFDADDVADLAQALSDQNVRRQGRFLLLKPTYTAALVKDNAIQNSQAYGGSEAIRENLSPRVHGFDVHEYTDIPANAEALEGIAGNKQGLIIAARVPGEPENWFGEVQNVSDPDTGLTLQLRQWYEGKDGKHYVTVTVMYGVGVGVAANIHRIRSA